jgi:hypothetical protein
MKSSKPTPRTDALMRRLASYCAGERGRQSKLARHLYPADAKAGIIRVSEWITRKKNPNGETTLAIQEWLARRTLLLARIRSASCPRCTPQA